MQNLLLVNFFCIVWEIPAFTKQAQSLTMSHLNNHCPSERIGSYVFTIFSLVPTAAHCLPEGLPFLMMSLCYPRTGELAGKLSGRNSWMEVYPVLVPCS
jgi:hypothetical protein